MGNLFTSRKNHRGKIPPGEFKVTIPENSLLSKQEVKGIPVHNTNLQMTISPFNARHQVCD